MFGLGIFENLLSSWSLFQVYAYLVFGLFSKGLFSKIQNLAFFKTEFGLFQLQAPGNPASASVAVSISYSSAVSTVYRGTSRMITGVLISTATTLLAVVAGELF